MKNTSSLQCCLAATLMLFAEGVAQSSDSMSQTRHELSIREALSLAEKTSPGLKASAARESQSKANIDIAQSYLYPSFHLNAADSFGFPGSSMPVPSQFGGLMNSPFRVGPTVGILGKVTLLDLGTWRGVDASREKMRSSQEETNVRRIQLFQSTLQTYFEAARFHGQMKVWRSIAAKTDEVVQTVKKFVKNGQYSEVQLLLIVDQLDEASMKEASFQERYRQALKRLALLTGLDAKEIDCPVPDSLEPESFGKGTTSNQLTKSSPLVTVAEAELKVANALASQVISEHLPKLYALGSVGLMNDARLVSQDNYSLWVGLTFPLFEGFRISSEVQRARAVVDEKENAVLASKLELQELNVSFDEQINVSRIQLNLLDHQHQSALRTFDLTKKRYLSFLEPVINLKEAIRNLARIETQMNEAKSTLLLAVGSKAALNGVF